MASPSTESSTAETDAITRLETRVRGRVVRPDHPGYDAVRALYNAMIDRRPAVIVRCLDIADVIATVAFAREQRMDLAIRGGGHSVSGLGSVDDGVVLDLSAMRGIRVDPIARTVRVEGGATWTDVDHATHAFSLATPSGIISSTGVGGLTLGGGIGHLSRKFGLTIDNLLEADVVLADGRLVTASTSEHPDLFWALRGGGGNFGVVTSFLFRLHHVDTVIAGPTLWPLDQAEDVLRWYRDFVTAAPDDLNGFFAFMTVPPAPSFPEALHLQKVCGVVWCYTGPAGRVGNVFAPVRAFGPPMFDGVQPMPFPTLQRAFDALYPPGMQWYMKADFMRDLPDAANALRVEHARILPTRHSGVHLYPVIGAVHDLAGDDTAFSFRDVTWVEVAVGVDPDPGNRELLTKWVRGYWDALHPYAAGGAYVNFLMDEGNHRIQAAYQDNYQRLARVKAQYDPGNLFHVNQNITPAHHLTLH